MGNLTEEQLRELSSNHQTYIETGILHGHQIEEAMKVFPIVHGIEIDLGLVEEVRLRCPGALIHHGSSPDVLQNLILRREPIFFYLDAHNCEGSGDTSVFPLWRELGLIRSRLNHNDVVVVDDVHTFGLARDDIRVTDALEWEGVTCESISSVLGAPLGEVIDDHYVVRWNNSQSSSHTTTNPS